jgi:PAS domain S-box-containing protein
MEKLNKGYEEINTVVPKLTLVLIQVIVLLSIFQMFRYLFFQDLASWQVSMATVFGSVVATITSFLLLYKYQGLLKEFSLQKDILEKLVTDRTEEMQQANLRMGQEIAERQRVQRALAESETRFRTIIREAAIGMAVVDKGGRLTEGNLALQKMLGYSAEQLQNMVIAQITHPEDLAQSRKLFEDLLEGTQRAFQIEERFVRHDGTVVWGRLSISLVRDAAGKPLFVIAMVEDISQRREAEEKISNYREQLQSLSLELSLTEERQKRRLAIDLHDHIGQALAVSKIKLGLLRKTAPSQQIATQLKEVQDLVEQMIKDTRSLTFELSLPVLYELGFEPAVEWLAHNIFKQHDIAVQVESNGQSMPLNNEMSILLFQMVRELLFNIVKHAQATLVRIAIQKVDDQLQVVVEDNGGGFDPAINDPKTGKVSGFGLFSIRERLNYFRGGLEIESEPGQGTRATITIPL